MLKSDSLQVTQEGILIETKSWKSGSLTDYFSIHTQDVIKSYDYASGGVKRYSLQSGWGYEHRSLLLSCICDSCFHSVDVFFLLIAIITQSNNSQCVQTANLNRLETIISSPFPVPKAAFLTTWKLWIYFTVLRISYIISLRNAALIM